MSIPRILGFGKTNYAKLDDSPKSGGSSSNSAVNELLAQKQVIRDEWRAKTRAYENLDPAKITDAQKREFAAFKEKALSILAKINGGLKNETADIPGLVN
jgi:hypothetical protein